MRISILHLHWNPVKCCRDWVPFFHFYNGDNLESQVPQRNYTKDNFNSGSEQVVYHFQTIPTVTLANSPGYRNNGEMPTHG